AGAKSVVASLWAASDVYTRNLMEHFYRYIMAGEDEGSALRHAQLDLIAPQRSLQNRPTVVTSKPANGPHPGRGLFYLSGVPIRMVSAKKVCLGCHQIDAQTGGGPLALPENQWKWLNPPPVMSRIVSAGNWSGWTSAGNGTIRTAQCLRSRSVMIRLAFRPA